MLSFNCETDGRAGTRGREKREKLIFQSIQVLSARCSIAWIDMWKDWQANWLAFACMWIYFPTKCVDLKLFHEARSDASFLITCVAERLSDSITVREEELHDVEHVITVISFKAKQLCLNLIISALFFFGCKRRRKKNRWCCWFCSVARFLRRFSSILLTLSESTEKFLKFFL